MFPTINADSVRHLVKRYIISAPDARNKYKKIHDRVGHYLHLKICDKYKISSPAHWYEYHPGSIVEGKM